MSSSMSSTSSETMRCDGAARPVPPTKLGSRLSAEASEGSPGLLTMEKPVRCSICCQRWSFSLSAAVTSPSACLKRESKNGWQRRGGDKGEEDDDGT